MCNTKRIKQYCRTKLSYPKIKLYTKRIDLSIPSVIGRMQHKVNFSEEALNAHRNFKGNAKSSLVRFLGGLGNEPVPFGGGGVRFMPGGMVT